VTLLGKTRCSFDSALALDARSQPARAAMSGTCDMSRNLSRMLPVAEMRSGNETCPFIDKTCRFEGHGHDAVFAGGYWRIQSIERPILSLPEGALLVKLTRVVARAK